MTRTVRARLGVTPGQLRARPLSPRRPAQDLPGTGAESSKQHWRFLFKPVRRSAAYPVPDPERVPAVPALRGRLATCMKETSMANVAREHDTQAAGAAFDPHAGRGGDRRRRGRAVPAAPAATAGAVGAGIYDTAIGRGRHLVLEPLSRAPSSTPSPTSTSTCSTRQLYKDWSWSQRFPGQAEIEQLAAVRGRPARPAARHPVRAPPSPARSSTNRAGAGSIDDQHRRGASMRSTSSPAAACCRRRWKSCSPARTAFKGRIFHTGRWPREPLDLSDKRVGVVGIGATGIQVIQTIADQGAST